MNNRGFCILPVLLLLIALSVLAAGCTIPAETATPDDSIIENPETSLHPPFQTSVEKVEIYHFHATRQCSSCITVGAYAAETVNTSFAPEVASGKVVFGHVNMELPENRALVERYGPTGASLWIGIYDGNGFHKEENVNVWYKIGNRDDYVTYLEGVIEKRLAGDFS
ncbi:MAG: nitrophenyl compound nitroreductase subunit ArsF family protein [Methanomicrobiales archaeon]|nr:nitrophenyl compound nitroreductase subunit ArsF family protein [Methanomicrobiales archaeon]